MFGLFGRKGPCKAQVMPSGRAVEVKPGANLLKAALEAGLAWPNSCKVGSCGTCRARLISGKIKPLNDFSYVLTGEELDRGMILACQTGLRSDIVVEVNLDEVASVAAKSVTGTIRRATPLTHDILEIRIVLDEALPSYAAGQYAELSIPGIDKPRSYSFARAPENEDEKHITFFVRHVPGGKMTGWLHAADRTGAKVTVTGPHGSFRLREARNLMLCIAGGSGLAPIKAMLEQEARGGFDRKVVFLFGARTQRDLYCLEEMGRFKCAGNGHFQYTPVLSHEPENSDWQGLRGLVTDYIPQQDLDLGSCHAYLCGPPPMIDAAIEALGRSGVPSEQIFFDKFLDASHFPGGRR